MNLSEYALPSLTHARHGNPDFMVAAVREVGPVDDRARVRTLRREGMSVRQIAYLTGIPRSTIGVWIKADHDSRPEPMPFYLHVPY